MKILIHILCLSIFWFSCEKDVYGCTDSDACNFNPEANIYDPSTCYYGVDSNQECGAEEDLDDWGLCNGDNSTCTFSLSIQLLDNGNLLFYDNGSLSKIFRNTNEKITRMLENITNTNLLPICNQYKFSHQVYSSSLKYALELHSDN